MTGTLARLTTCPLTLCPSLSRAAPLPYLPLPPPPGLQGLRAPFCSLPLVPQARRPRRGLRICGPAPTRPSPDVWCPNEVDSLHCLRWPQLARMRRLATGEWYPGVLSGVFVSSKLSFPQDSVRVARACEPRASTHVLPDDLVNVDQSATPGRHSAEPASSRPVHASHLAVLVSLVQLACDQYGGVLTSSRPLSTRHRLAPRASLYSRPRSPCHALINITPSSWSPLPSTPSVPMSISQTERLPITDFDSCRPSPTSSSTPLRSRLRRRSSNSTSQRPHSRS